MKRLFLVLLLSVAMIASVFAFFAKPDDFTAQGQQNKIIISSVSGRTLIVNNSFNTLLTGLFST